MSGIKFIFFTYDDDFKNRKQEACLKYSDSKTVVQCVSCTRRFTSIFMVLNFQRYAKSSSIVVCNQ